VLLPLSAYWEHIRKFYMQFEEGLSSPATDIYRYEIPGGQYTNLKTQVESLGLGEHFYLVKEKYKEFNEMIGDIVKVTPSSKMVGDMAIMMVQNGMSKENFIEKGKDLTFPDSVVSYFSGMMGQPQNGFPKDIQEIVLKGKQPISGRPGESLAEIDFDAVIGEMKPFCPEPTMQDVVSYCLYPKVMKDFFEHRQEYSDISHLDTPVFFNGLGLGESTEINLDEGKTLYTKLLSIGEPDAENNRVITFELNGSRRSVVVTDTTQGETKITTIMADAGNPMEIGTSIPGMISKLRAEKGDTVKKNDVLAVIEAMKMETVVVAKADGVIDEVLVKERQPVKAGELIIKMRR
jgi:pyruvate carboxylase